MTFKREDKITLETISQELFDIFETEVDFQKECNHAALLIRSDQYFSKLSQDLEMRSFTVDNAKMGKLADTFKREIVPVYMDYWKIKSDTDKKINDRNLWNWVFGTVIAFELLEAVVSRGRSLNPLFMLPSALIEGVVGAGFYKFMNWKDYTTKRSAEIALQTTVKNIESRIASDDKYVNFQEISDGTLFRAETFKLLKQYSNATEFWRDYKKVVSANPQNEVALTELNVPKFCDFLELHVKGAFTPEKRTYRINQLFIEAHKYFMETEPEYIRHFTF